MFRVFLALVSGLLVVGSVIGQETSLLDAEPTLGGDVKPGHALRITISGSLELSLVRRNSAFFRAAVGDAITGAQLTDPTTGAVFLGRTGTTFSSSNSRGGDVFLDPQLTLDFDVQLAERVSAFVQVWTPFNTLDDAGGRNTGNGTVVQSRHVLEVEQAYIEWEQAFVEELTLKFGVVDFAKDFVGHGNPFLVDVAHSESPFGNPGVNAGGANPPDSGSPQSASTGFVGSQEAAGALGIFDFGGTELDVFYFTINEDFRGGDEDVLFGSTIERSFETSGLSGQLGGALLFLQNDPGSTLVTFGGGGAARTFDGDLEFYGEAYGQAGQYTRSGGGVLGSRDVDQKDAYAAYGGIRLGLRQLPGRPYVDVSYWEISGDDEGNDSRNENWVSLENNNDTIVVEDGLYGLDIDTNYRAVKVKGGFQFEDPWTNSPWRVQLLYAYFEFQDNNGTVDNAPGSSRDKIGDEIDLNVYYYATDYLTFRFGSGWLLDPRGLGFKKDLQVTLFQAGVQF